MEEQTVQALMQIFPALKALAKSVERSIHQDTYQGTGRMAVKSYQGLHKKVAALLPDDDYIVEALALEVESDASDQQMVGQVQLAVNQLVTYLEGQLAGSRMRGGFPQPPRPPRPPRSPRFPGENMADEIRELGQELRDRILFQTRDALRKAMESIDVNIEIDDDDEVNVDVRREKHTRSEGGKTKKRIIIRKSDDESVDDEGNEAGDEGEHIDIV